MIAGDKIFELIANQAPRYIQFAVEAAGSDLLTLIKSRAFPSTASEGGDADGNAIKRGKAYSPAWAKVRKDKGRQVQYVDLQFTDNLSRNGIKGSETPDGYVIDFTNAQFTERARGLEERYNQIIFAASKEEADKTLDTIERLFFRQINDTVNASASI